MNNSGFTLIEFICVVLILGIMATVVVTKYVDFSGSAKDEIIKYETKAVERYNVVKSTGMETGVEK